MKLLNLLVACTASVQLALASSWGMIGDFSINATTPALDKRYAELITSSGTFTMQLQPWPMRSQIWKQDEGYVRTIPYCYVDRNTYQRLGSNECMIRSGINLWAEVLGGGAAVKREHSLGFREPGNSEIWCCRSYKLQNFECDWDFNSWPPDTLAIHWMPHSGFNAEASLGYAHYNDPKAGAGANWLRMTEYASPADVAHELGHVLGLVHEHQRWDRDDYLEFRCMNLLNIVPKINEMVAKEGVSFDEARQALCENYEKAREYNSPSFTYIKGAGLDINIKPALDGPGGLDINSIMMYDSFHGSAHSPYDRVDTAVLVAIKRDANGNKIPGSETMFRAAQKPSPKDAEFVKRFYPWDQAAYDKYTQKHPRKKR